MVLRTNHPEIRSPIPIPPYPIGHMLSKHSYNYQPYPQPFILPPPQPYLDFETPCAPVKVMEWGYVKEKHVIMHTR